MGDCSLSIGNESYPKMKIAVVVVLFACLAYASACAECGQCGPYPKAPRQSRSSCGHSHSHGSSHSHSSSHSHGSSHGGSSYTSSSTSSSGSSCGHQPPKCRKLFFPKLPMGGAFNYQKIKARSSAGLDADAARPNIPALNVNVGPAPKLRNNKDISAAAFERSLPEGGHLNYRKVKAASGQAGQFHARIPANPNTDVASNAQHKLRNNKDISAFPLENSALPAAYSCQFKPSKPSCGHTSSVHTTHSSTSHSSSGHSHSSGHSSGSSSSSGHSCKPGCPPKCQLEKEKNELESKIAQIKCALKAAKKQLKANKATFKRCYGAKPCPPPPCPKPAPKPKPCPPPPCRKPRPPPCPKPCGFSFFH